MSWIEVAILVVVTLLVILTLVSYLRTPVESAIDRMLIEAEVRQAERRLHDIARESFAAMLAEARAHERR